MNPVLGVLLTIGVIASLMAAVSVLQSRFALHDEVARKIVHVGAGLLAMSFPWLLANSYAVAAACGLNALALAVTRHAGRVPARLKRVLGGVDRGSNGEFYFPLAIAVLYPLAAGNLSLYLVPVGILTFADTAAAVVGSRFNPARGAAESGKSIEGSLAFFAVTLVLTRALLGLLTGLEGIDLLSISFVVALATTMIEAVSLRGTDNLAVPLTAFLCLFASIGGAEPTGLVEAGPFALLGWGLAGAHHRRAEAPRSGFVRRMRVYLSEMFPIPLRVGTAAVYTLGVASLVRLGLGLRSSPWTAFTLLGIWTLFFHMLVLRLMDELKDVQVDRELFADRPLPSGRVKIADIRAGLAIALVLLLAPNLAVSPATWLAVLLIVYSWLMFRFFFVPDLLRRHLLLNLATHNPVVVLVVVYVIGLVAQEHGLRLADVGLRLTLLLVAYFWPATFAWEIARKIRSGEEETAYVTYSQIFGRRGAVLLATGAQTLTLLTGVVLYRSLELSRLFLLALAGAWLVAQWAHLRFVRRPSPTTSKLRPYAEGFVLGAVAAPLLELLVGAGAGPP